MIKIHKYIIMPNYIDGVIETVIAKYFIYYYTIITKVWYNHPSINVKKDEIKMLEIILEMVKTILLMIGVILIYDARTIAKKVFSFGDQNEATLTLKIIGFIMSIVAGFLILM